MAELQITKGTSRKSAYDLRNPDPDGVEYHTLAVIVDNEAGVLARVIGLFSGRGYNIESLTVAEVDHKRHKSRITIVTSGTPSVINQIEAELSRLVPVYSVSDLTRDGFAVEREMALLKLGGPKPQRDEAQALAKAAHAKIVAESPNSFILEYSGSTEEIDGLADKMRAFGLKEIARTGVVGISLNQ